MNTSKKLHRSRRRDGIALVATLAILALLLGVVTTFLLTAKQETSNSRVYADSLNARMMAETANAAAIASMKQGMQFGNYVTAMNPPTDGYRITEIHYPEFTPGEGDDISTNRHLRLNFDSAENNVYDYLASLTNNGYVNPQIPNRPNPTTLSQDLDNYATFDADKQYTNLNNPYQPTGGQAPDFSNEDTRFDFNRTIKIDDVESQLISPDGTPAYAQWVPVRDVNNNIIGRYSYYIEDESMKVNLNAAGKSLPRTSDEESPFATFEQAIEELDVSGVLNDIEANKALALDDLESFAPPASRQLPSTASTTLIGGNDIWETNGYGNFAPFTTIFSESDNTTAKGWKRINPNKVVAEMSSVDAANFLSNYMKEAWTGPEPLADMDKHQIFSDDRLRTQLAANIVDFLDDDNIPTDMGDIEGKPTIGIEKLPYIITFMIVFKNLGPIGDKTAADNAQEIELKTTKLEMNLYFTFIDFFNVSGTGDSSFNFSDPDNPASVIKKIKINQLPKLHRYQDYFFEPATENGISFPLEINIASDLKLADPDADNPNVLDIGLPEDGNSTSGMATLCLKTPYVFDVEVLMHDSEVDKSNLKVTPKSKRTRAQTDIDIELEILGANNERIDITEIEMSNSETIMLLDDRLNLEGVYTDMMREVSPGGDLERAAIILLNYRYLDQADIDVKMGDPFFRPDTIDDRWYYQLRTDNARIVQLRDCEEHEVSHRTFGHDFYNSVQRRPFTRFSNGPINNIGDLGYIVTSEYPFRTIYFDYPYRQANTPQDQIEEEIPERRQGVRRLLMTADSDYPGPSLQGDVTHILADLFTTTDEETISGQFNVNSQAVARKDGAPQKVTHGAFHSLFQNLRLGGLVDGPWPWLPVEVDDMASKLANRRYDDGNPPDPDNILRRPFFTRGELASPIAAITSYTNDPDDEVDEDVKKESYLFYSIYDHADDNKSVSKSNFPPVERQGIVEAPFRTISNTLTTKGNVFRVLSVGQSVQDTNGSGTITPDEVRATHLREFYVRRIPSFTDVGGFERTTDCTFEVIQSRAILE